MKNIFLNSILIVAISLIFPKMVKGQHIQYIEDQNGADFLHHSIVDYPEERTVIVGTVEPAPIGGNSDILLMMLDNEGQVIWSNYLNYETLGLSHDDFAGSIMIDSDKNIVITGYTQNASNLIYPYKLLFIAKFDENGNSLNNIVLADPGLEGNINVRDLYGFDIEQNSEAGDYIIVGLGSDPASLITSDKFAFVTRIDKGLKSVLWNKRFRASSINPNYIDYLNSFNHILKIENYPDYGEVFLLTGSTANDVQLTYNVLIEPNGNIIWQKSCGYHLVGPVTGGLSSLYSSSTDLFYTLFNVSSGSSSPNGQMVLVTMNNMGVLTNKMALSINGSIDTNLFINDMKWADSMEQNSIVFTGYEFIESTDTAHPVVFSINVHTMSVDWAHTYPPEFDMINYQNLLAFSGEVVEPLHFDNTQRFYQPKPLIKTESGYTYSSISVTHPGTPFALTLINTDSNGSVNRCMEELELSSDIQSGNDNWPIAPYEIAFLRPDPLLNIFPTDPKSIFVCSEAEKKNLNRQNTERSTNISIYPNPTKGLLYISSNEEIEKITVYNLIGQIIHSSESSSLDFSKFPSGIYLIEVMVNGKTEIHKIIKE